MAVVTPLTAIALLASVQWVGQAFPGFFVMENAVIPTVGGYQWPPEKSTFFHSRVTAVEDLPVASGSDVFAAIADHAPGDLVRYTLAKDGRTFDVTLALRTFGWSDYLQTYGILFLFGCANLGMGLVVGFLQPRTRQALVFLLHTTVAGLYPITAIFLHRPDFLVMNKLCLFMEALVSATFIHIALTFPVERTFKRPGRRTWIAIPYALSGGLLLYVLGGFNGDPPSVEPLQYSYLATAVGLAFFLGMMAFGYWEDRDGRVRARIKAVLPGAILASTVQFFVFVNNAYAGGDIPVQFGLLTPIPYYLGLAYAIAKHDLFDVDRVVRLSFVYGLMSVIVVGTYALVLQIPTLLFPTIGESQAVIGILFVLVLAFAFDPLRQGIQGVVDRAFYRKRLDYRSTIAELTEVLTTLLDQREIVAQVIRVVTDAMQLDSVSIGLVQGEDASVWRAENGRLQDRREPGMRGIITAIERFPHTFRAEALPVDHTSTAPDSPATLLDRLGAQVVLPLTFRGKVNGALVLGAKQSGQPYDSEAIDLLRTLANQAAIAVQNARSYQALQVLNRDLDAKVQQQTRELRVSNQELTRAYENLKDAQAQLIHAEKMASLGQLVAGVAHELNNPASFVHGGLTNLEEYLSRIMDVLEAYESSQLTDRAQAERIAALRKDVRLDYLLRETPELLRVCFEGSERINCIVEDLRVFARADSGHRKPAQIQDGIESSIRLLNNHLSRGAVDVERDYQEIPPIRADTGQLNRVWMNLLANAVDAVEGRPGAKIKVKTRLLPANEKASAMVEVAISDNGPGVEPDIAARIFEPFFSTKPIGKGTGLGLSIAYGAVKSHGGTIEVGPAEKGGARLTVRLPVDEPSASP